MAGPLTIRKSTPDPAPAESDGYDPEKSLAAHTRRIFNVKPEDEKEPLTRSTLAVADTIDWLMRHGPTQVKQGLSEMLDGEIAKGGVKAVRGTALTAGAILAPSIARAAVAAPAAMATDLALGTGVGVGTYKTVKPAARMMGATEDQAELAAELAGFATGVPTSMYATPRVLGAAERAAAKFRPAATPPPPPPGAPPGRRAPLQVTFQPTDAATPAPARPAGNVSNWPGGPGVAQARAADQDYSHGAYVRAEKAAAKKGRYFDDLIAAAPPTKKFNYKKELADSALPHIEAHATGDLTSGDDTFSVALDSADNAVEFMHKRSEELINAFPDARIKTNPLAAAIERLQQHENVQFLDQGVASLLERYPVLRAPGQLTLKRADRIRYELSKANTAKLRENKWDRATLRANDPVFAADEQAMIALRKGVYDGLEDEGIAGVAAMRKAEGDVIEFRDMLGQHAHKGATSVPGSGLPHGARDAIMAIPVLPYRVNRAIAGGADILAGKSKRNELLAAVFKRRAANPDPRPTYPSLSGRTAAPPTAGPAPAVATPPMRPGQMPLPVAGPRVPGVGRPAPQAQAAGPMVPGVGRPAPAPPPPPRPNPMVPGLGRPAPPRGPNVPGLGRPAPQPQPPAAAVPAPPPAPEPNVPGLGRPMPATQQRPPRPVGAQEGSRYQGTELDAAARQMGVWLNDEQLALAETIMQRFQRNPMEAILTVIQRAPALATRPPVQKQLPAPRAPQPPQPPGRVFTPRPPPGSTPGPDPSGGGAVPAAVAARDEFGRPIQFSGDPSAVDTTIIPPGGQRQLPAPPRTLVTPPPPAPPRQPARPGVTRAAVVARDRNGNPIQFSGDPNAVDVPVTPAQPIPGQRQLEPPPRVLVTPPPPVPADRSGGGAVRAGVVERGPNGEVIQYSGDPNAPAGPAPPANTAAAFGLEPAPARVTAWVQLKRAEKLAQERKDLDMVEALDIVRKAWPETAAQQAAPPEGSNVARMLQRQAEPAPAPVEPEPKPSSDDLVGGDVSPERQALAKIGVENGRTPEEAAEIVAGMTDEQVTEYLAEYDQYLAGKTANGEPPVLEPEPDVKKKDPIAEGRRRRPNREDRDLTPGELQTRLYIEGITLSIPQVERVQTLLRAGATREDAVSQVLADADIPDTNRLLSGGADDPVALADSRPGGMELHVGTHIRQKPGESKRALQTRRNQAKQAAFEARYSEHYRELFKIVSAHARRIDPDLDWDVLRSAFDERLELYEDSVGEWLASGENPITVLRRIAKMGGIKIGDKDLGGEISLLMEGTQFGDVAGVKGVFRKNGRDWDEVVDWLGDGGEGEFKNIKTHDDLTRLIDGAIRHGLQYEEGVLPGSDSLRDLGVDLDRPWWRSAEKPPAADEDGDAMSELDDFFSNPEGDAPAPADAPPWADIVDGWIVDKDGNKLEYVGGEDAPPGELPIDDPKVDILDSGEEQPRLPGDVGDVRDQNIEQPKIELPFSLSGGVNERPQGTTADLFGNPIPPPEAAPTASNFDQLNITKTLKSALGTLNWRINRIGSEALSFVRNGRMTEAQAEAFIAAAEPLLHEPAPTVEAAKALEDRAREMLFAVKAAGKAKKD